MKNPCRQSFTGPKQLLNEQWRHMRKLLGKESITVPHRALLGSPSLGTPSPLNLTDTGIDWLAFTLVLFDSI